MKRDVKLWAAILVPPVVWFVNLLASFALAPIVCSGGRLYLYLFSSIALAVIVVSAVLAMSQWHQVRVSDKGDDPRSQRVRSMAVAGMVLGCAFILVLVAQWVPQLVMAGCQ